MKKMISMMLVLAMVIGIVPTQAFAAGNDSNIFEISVNSAVAREGASQKQKVAAAFQKGDCLTMTGKSKNSAGNTWYTFSYQGKTLYIYSGNVTKHSHAYTAAANSNRISYCKCGSVQVTKLNGNMPMGYADTVMLPMDEIALALGAMGAQIGAVGSAAAAAMPYVGAGILLGVYLSFIVNNSGTQVQDVAEVRTDIDLSNFFKNSFDTNEPYHKAAIVKNYSLMLMERDGMTTSEALKYTNFITKDTTLADSALYNGAPRVLLNVYTDTGRHANELCTRYANQGPLYGFGQSMAANGKAEDCKIKNVKNIYFNHFHLWYTGFNSTSLTKIRDVHILYGLPTGFSPIPIA